MHGFRFLRGRFYVGFEKEGHRHVFERSSVGIQERNYKCMGFRKPVEKMRMEISLSYRCIEQMHPLIIFS
jgi:hypothetical protein